MVCRNRIMAHKVDDERMEREEKGGGEGGEGGAGR